MARPRVFVSSTYFDLRHIRTGLEDFIQSLGYDSVLFESGDIPFQHDQPIDESCYSEIHNCHMFVLVIGGRYGSPSSDSKAPTGKDLQSAYEHYNSITRKEYEAARGRDIPVFIFVEKNVLAEYQTYKDNRENVTIKYAHVDSVNIYRLLDDILSQRRNNFVRAFENLEDIASWLRDQWAGLFADALTRRKDETSINDLSGQITELSGVSAVLKEYTESMMRKIQPDDYQAIITEQVKRLRASKIRAFARDGMIGHLLGQPETKVGRAALFTAFEQSTSLEDFLKRAKFDKKFIAHFLELHGEYAMGDYDQLVARFKGDDDTFDID